MTARAWVMFLSVATLWGVPYFFIKVAIEDGVPPAFVAWARVTFAAVLLGGLCRRLGLFTELRGRWRTLSLYAIVEIAIPFPLIAAAEDEISSSLAAILIATTPLIIALLALRFDHAERAEGRRLVGLMVGFAGVVALVGIDVAGEPRELLGAAAILLAAAGYATGPMLIKRGFTEVDPRATTAGALIVAALILTPAALAAPPDTMPPTEALASLAILGIFCTALAFVLFTALVREVGPGRATVITYVAPLIALSLGIAALDERPGAGAIIGLGLIVAGSSLATRAPRSPGRAELAPRPAPAAPTTTDYYELTARQYATEISPTPPGPRADALRRLVTCLPLGAIVLEVGSGTGRDADYVETLGAHVRRTDVANAFIELQAERGKHAERLDLLTDELGGPYNAILAMCVLIHVDRARTDAVLHKVATALRSHGTFLVSVREGAGEHADGCHITYWHREEFAARLADAGLRVEWDSRDVDSADETWLTFLARRSH